MVIQTFYSSPLSYGKKDFSASAVFKSIQKHVFYITVKERKILKTGFHCELKLHKSKEAIIIHLYVGNSSALKEKKNVTTCKHA